MRLASELHQKEAQFHAAQTDLVKAQTRAAQSEDEAKAHQDDIKGLQVNTLLHTFFLKNINRNANVIKGNTCFIFEKIIRNVGYCPTRNKNLKACNKVHKIFIQNKNKVKFELVKARGRGHNLPIFL
jgi:hypothetical protein